MALKIGQRVKARDALVLPWQKTRMVTVHESRVTNIRSGMEPRTRQAQGFAEE